MRSEKSSPVVLQAHRHHPRLYQDNQFVYPVLSRRSHGLSLGINLSPHKRCNFDCPYCQVDRTVGMNDTPTYDLNRVEQELRLMIRAAQSGELFGAPQFAAAPDELKRLNDIALSGDGEPTAEVAFLDTCKLCASLRHELGLNDVKLIVITNATMLHRPAVKEGLDLLTENNGEIWAKLDAGSEPYYQTINKTSIPFQRVLDNLAAAARERPIIIQTLFTCIDGVAVPPSEIRTYTKRLNDILVTGGTISAVQLHTIARKPADSRLTSIEKDDLDQIAQSVRRDTGLEVQVYYGTEGS